ncbi:hypothetical protein ACFLR8_02260 [Bacteroidota bacterium]
MKKQLFHLFLGISLILLFGYQNARAQDKSTTKVQITITEDDKVTSDTTFELKEGHDPEMIKKVVSSLAGQDLHMKHMSQDVHVSHGGQKEMIWISSDGEKVWHTGNIMEGICIDSITQAHKDARVLVIKNKDGEVEVMEVGDEDGEHHKMMYIECETEGENVNVYVIKKGDDDVRVEKEILVEIEKEHESDAKGESEEKEKKKKKK